MKNKPIAIVVVSTLFFVAMIILCVYISMMLRIERFNSMYEKLIVAEGAAWCPLVLQIYDEFPAKTMAKLLENIRACCDGGNMYTKYFQKNGNPVFGSNGNVLKIACIHRMNTEDANDDVSYSLNQLVSSSLDKLVYLTIRKNNVVKLNLIDINWNICGYYEYLNSVLMHLTVVGDEVEDASMLKINDITIKYLLSAPFRKKETE